MPTSSVGRFAAWDVIVVPFPYSDRLAEKRRPALVVSGPSLLSFGLVWLAMITSAENESWDCDVPIHDLRGAGLPSASVVRPAKIACIEPNRILRRAGKLDGATARKVAAVMGKFIAGR
jgi:mRNA interferase MazF